MKGFFSILVFLGIGMLFFGCTASTEYSADFSAGDNATGAGTSGGAQEPAGNGTGAADSAPGASSGTGGAPATGGSGSGEEQPAEPSPADSAAIDMSGKDYSDLIGGGSGSRCTVSYKPETGAPEMLTLYFDGKHNIRMEQETGYSDCPQAVIVYRGDSSGNGMLYLTCPGHNEEALGQKFGSHEQCEWQSMEIEEQWGGIGTASRGLESGYSTPMLEYLSEPSYSCTDWAVDSSKFGTPGFVCD
ncbi:hypothetical protein L0Y65_06870 [Candidatus Micrarchaeota archaeon]|nr:hypothetical protein [Candidatus Micrarchaeota archaeon]